MKFQPLTLAALSIAFSMPSAFAAIEPDSALFSENAETELAASPDEVRELKTLLEQETRPASLETGNFRQPADLNHGTIHPQDSGPNTSLYQELDESSEDQSLEMQTARAETISELATELDSESVTE